MCWLQAKQARVCAEFDSDRSTVDILMDEVDEAELGLRKVMRKGRAGMVAAEERLVRAKEQVSAVRRSAEHQHHDMELRQLMTHFPELILRYPELEYFRGTAGEVRCTG
jgi:hypothetical protein